MYENNIPIGDIANKYNVRRNIILGILNNETWTKVVKRKKIRKSGPSRGEEHYFTTLTKKDVLEMREKYIPYKYSVYKLAKEYNVSPTTVNQIILRNRWKHI
jgi:predicted DNA-binding protein YlxM (UPF0122 family)